MSIDTRKTKNFLLSTLKYLVGLILYVILISLFMTGIVIVSDKFIDGYIDHNIFQVSIVNDTLQQESKDSLAAIMSIIVESNRVLVDERENCKYYILTHTKVPEYVKLSKDVNINPSKELYLWIPVDYTTYKNATIGTNLATPDLVIGNTPYNGDIEHIELKIISKDKR